MFLWFELCNAITMLSPLAAWHRHRKKHKKKRMHKLLAVHIPISMMYHFCCSAPFTICKLLQPHLRIIDLCCIHIYALVAAQDIKTYLKPELHCGRERYHIHVHPSFTKALNMTCVLRIFYGHEDKIARIFAIYLCTLDGLKECTRCKKHRVLFCGSLSSCLYMFDESLYKCGHSLFHLLLGGIHTQLYKLMA